MKERGSVFFRRGVIDPLRRFKTKIDRWFSKIKRVLLERMAKEKTNRQLRREKYGVVIASVINVFYFLLFVLLLILLFIPGTFVVGVPLLAVVLSSL